jgi:hypothetical protein
MEGRNIRLILLRVFLLYGALGWGVCLVGVVVPGAVAFDLLGYIGGIEPHALVSDPMYDYWLRMASSVFGFLGVLFLILAIRPEKFANVLPLAGCFMLLEGIVLLVHGLRLHLPLTPMAGDVSFCLLCGIGILVCMKRAKRSESREITQ